MSAIKYRIAVDAMGGDYYPEVPVHGTLRALKELPGNFLIQLVGSRRAIEDELSKRMSAMRYRGYDKSRLEIIEAPQVILMNDEPAASVLAIPNSSIHVGVRLQRNNFSDAFVSAGNTGAIMAVSLTSLGRIRDVYRPVLTGVFPTMNGYCVIADLGANAEATVELLVQSAQMAVIYARHVLGCVNPRVALMNIGEEEGKGNKLTIEAYHELKKLREAGQIQFVGNVEGRDVFRGRKADVIIMDGFVGNVLLKFAEDIMPLLKDWQRALVKKGPPLQKVFAYFGKVLLGPLQKTLKKELDYQKYGGVPLLGINGNVTVCHGGSSPLAIVNAIAQAGKMVEQDIINKIKNQLTTS